MGDAETDPYVVAEEEEAVGLDRGLGDVKVLAEEGDDEGVDEVVEEFGEEGEAFLGVGLGKFCGWRDGGRTEPVNVGELGSVRSEENSGQNVEYLDSLDKVVKCHRFSPTHADKGVELGEDDFAVLVGSEKGLWDDFEDEGSDKCAYFPRSTRKIDKGRL